MRDFAYSSDRPASGRWRAVQHEPVRVFLAAPLRQFEPIQFVIAEKTIATQGPVLFNPIRRFSATRRFNWSHADV